RRRARRALRPAPRDDPIGEDLDLRAVLGLVVRVADARHGAEADLPVGVSIEHELTVVGGELASLRGLPRERLLAPIEGVIGARGRRKRHERQREYEGCARRTQPLPYLVMLIDTHSHVSDPGFNADRAAVLARAREAGVGTMIDIGTDITTSRRALKLASEQ